MRKALSSLTMGLIAMTSVVVGEAAQAPQRTARSITRHDITWTFDKEYPVGEFVNGDPWVLGPLTIVSVTPGWDEEVNGSQVDPPVTSHGQGLRKEYKFGAPYRDELRAKFPLKLEGTHSVLSTIGMKP